jgi:hypothetical protein
MKHWFLAAALLFASAGLVCADYVILVANLGQQNELQAQPNQGMPPGFIPPGPQPGVMPGRGRNPQGALPGGNFGGGQPGVGSPAGNFRGGPGMGMLGGGPAGMMPPGGMAPGMMPGGGMPDAEEIEDTPYFIVSVVEVDAAGDLPKKLATQGFASVRLPRWNGGCNLVAKTPISETIVLTRDRDNKPLPSVHRQFDQKLAETLKGTPSAEQILELAEWTLTHGLIDKFPQVMDKLTEVDKSHPAAVAYLKIKEAIDKPAAKDSTSATLRERLLSNYRVMELEHYHYLILHNSPNLGEVRRYLDQLENSFRGFYYWFALRGIVLPVPAQQQLAVLTGQEKDFNHFHTLLSAGPVVADGFLAPRENVAVLSTRRLDEPYDMLEKYWKVFGTKGYIRQELLLGKKGLGHPKLASLEEIYVAQTIALQLKAMESEAELASISHDTARQLVFASGLLPRNIAVPEWILFGIGSFFETPLVSPWPSLAAPSPYYLPRWREMKTKGLEKSPVETLKKVVSNSYFQNLPPDGPPESPQRHAHDAALRKARTAAWSLTYYLAKSKLAGLQRYLKELSKMPRDIELSEEVLLDCFARAFEAIDANGKPDNAKLSSLAAQWYSYLDTVKFESESTMKQIRDHYRKMMEPQANPPAQTNPATGNQ